MVAQNRKFAWLDGALLVCLVAVVFGRTIGFGFQTHWDDNGYILNNPAAREFTWEHIKAAFSIAVSRNNVGQYNPLSMLSFMLDYTLWDLNPAGFHFTNLLIHTLNGLLVYRLLLRLHAQRMIALVGSIIFLIHPVQVESVAWVSERKGLLSLLFLLISWEGYQRYRDALQGRGWPWYVVSLAAFVLSLLAKTAGVVMPLILLLYDRCFPKNGRRSSFVDTLPFFAVSALFSAIEIYAGKTKGVGGIVGYHGGSPLATFYTMLTVFCRYLRLLVWPSGLNVEHLPPVHRTIDMAVIAAALLLTGIGYATVRLYRYDKRLGFWGLFFWIGLLPVSQIIPTILMMYEHYLYMPIIAVSALVGSGALRLRERIGTSRAPILYTALGIWFCALSVTSYQRTAVWRNSLTLFADATVKSPGGARVWETFGEVNYFLGNKEAARAALEKSQTLNPNSTDVLWALAEVNTEMGDLDKGSAYLTRLFEKNPNFARGWATLGNNYRYRGDLAKAKEMYNKALAIQPDAIQVEMLLAKLAIQEKKPDEARLHLIKVENDKRGWNTSESAYLMTCTEALAGRKDQALAWLETALKRGYSDYYTLNTAPELSSIWDDPRFNYLMLRAFPEQEQAR